MVWMLWERVEGRLERGGMNKVERQVVARGPE